MMHVSIRSTRHVSFTQSHTQHRDNSTRRQQYIHTYQVCKEYVKMLLLILLASLLADDCVSVGPCGLDFTPLSVVTHPHK
jgi:hypothetical protein